jgi:hypothetical protein
LQPKESLIVAVAGALDLSNQGNGRVDSLLGSGFVDVKNKAFFTEIEG